MKLLCKIFGHKPSELGYWSASQGKDAPHEEKYNMKELSSYCLRCHLVVTPYKP